MSEALIASLAPFVADLSAWDRFLALGLPTPRDEAYRYVRLKNLYEQTYAPPETREVVSSAHALFLDGTLQQCRFPQGVVALSLAQAKKQYGSLLESRFAKWLKEERDPFACLNGALAKEGLFLYIPPSFRCETPFVVEMVCQTPSFLHPRIHVVVGKGAEAHFTLLDHNHNLSLTNCFLDLSLEENARVVIHAQPSSSHMDFFRAVLKKRSCLRCVTAHFTAPFLRQDYDINLLGEEAEVALYGLSVLEKSEQAHTHIRIEHAAPHTRSLQKFKGVLKEQSRASFQGKIYVQPIAQKTEAYQLCNYLISGEKASANCKPNLEIFADDVKASHGATVGRLNAEHLFYLQSRGVSKKAAEELLIQGFIQEIMEEL
ncbi:MAG: SufB/SufD family protein [Chlamydiales bacterium]